jgi:hypothetical protein
MFTSKSPYENVCEWDRDQLKEKEYILGLSLFYLVGTLVANKAPFFDGHVTWNWKNSPIAARDYLHLLGANGTTLTLDQNT